jgi:hypothetical protein
MHITLLRKLADIIDGIDLSGHVVGDVIDLPHEHADLLVAEGWAEYAAQIPGVGPSGSQMPIATAADAPPRRRRPRR